MVLPDEARYEEVDCAPRGRRVASVSGIQARTEWLAQGRRLPEWFTRPEIAAILAQVSPPRHGQGLCVWLTGLSGAGKTTIASALTVLLVEHGRQTTVLDGDVVRTHLSKDLGFSRDDRDANVRRIGFVAAEVVRHRGAVICAAVSPYEATRNECRQMIGEDQFVLVYVATPLEVCEQRDPKGLYAKARRGELRGFTGIDDPYESPARPGLVLTTLDADAEECARRVLSLLAERGLVRPDVAPSR